MKNYIKDLFNVLSCINIVFSSLILLMVVATWDVSMFEGDRFWNDGTKTFIRLSIILSILLSFILRFRLTIKLK